MDVFKDLKESHKEKIVETIRRPLAPAEKNNGITTRRHRTREVSSSYKSPTPATSSNFRRYPSPNLTRTVSSSSSSQLGSKRALSAERRMPSTPSPVRPSTPVSDTTANSQVSSKKITSSRMPEVLWPSTMRSLSVSFQSDSVSVPVGKKERPVVSHSHALLDRTSSNVAQKPAGAVASLRKSTPERKRSPLKGRNSCPQSENSKSVDGLQARLIDQQRWPSKAGGGKSSSTTLGMAKTVDLSDKSGKIWSTLHSSTGLSRKRLSAYEVMSKPPRKTSSDASTAIQSVIDDGIDTVALSLKSVDDSLLRVSAVTVRKVGGFALNPAERSPLATPLASVRFGSLPGSRLPSPSRASSLEGWCSPSRTRPSTPTQTRGTSPSRIRPSSPTRQTKSVTSVLSFIADIKQGKKISQLVDAHQLRLLYNRYVQWRFANAQLDAAMCIQKITAEQTLYNVWRANLELWNLVTMKRSDLQQLKLELKLNSVLSEQIQCLEDWALFESDHTTSLDSAIKDLKACTLRLPITGGAKADIDTLKAAISSAIDVMQAMGSSIFSVLSKVEGLNGLVSGLAELAGQERSILNGCDALLASTAAMQVREYSLRTQQVQSQQVLSR